MLWQYFYELSINITVFLKNGQISIFLDADKKSGKRCNEYNGSYYPMSEISDFSMDFSNLVI